MADDAGGFLARWARRKELARTGEAPAPQPLVPAPAPPAPPSVVPPAADAAGIDARRVEPARAAEPLPTLADVALLTRESDYSRFVASGVDEGVKRAAMKKLFADPHFNVMDGLDTYIDDYGKPDPIPLAMLRQMNQSKFLRLFDDEEGAEPDAANKSEESVTVAAATDPAKPPDDHPDLRLQQDDAAGRPGTDQGAGA